MPSTFILLFYFYYHVIFYVFIVSCYANGVTLHVKEDHAIPTALSKIWVFTEQKPSRDQQVTFFVLYRLHIYVCIRLNNN